MSEPVKQLIGCAELPPGMSRANYFEKLDFLEVASFFTNEPSRKVVRAWREKSPQGAAFSVIAHQSLTQPGFQPGDKSLETTLQLVDFCEILRAEAVVFKTPASFAPSSKNRERLKTYFTEEGTSERFGTTQRVWDPDGLWEPSTISDLAEELDILVAVDPLAVDPFDEHAEHVARNLARGRAYLRVSGMGLSRRRFESYQLEMLGEMLLELERSWVVFAHPSKYPDALSFSRMLSEE